MNQHVAHGHLGTVVKNADHHKTGRPGWETETFKVASKRKFHSSVVVVPSSLGTPACSAQPVLWVGKILDTAHLGTSNCLVSDPQVQMRHFHCYPKNWQH